MRLEIPVNPLPLLLKGREFDSSHSRIRLLPLPDFKAEAGEG
jgi:hypothetical protein